MRLWLIPQQQQRQGLQPINYSKLLRNYKLSLEYGAHQHTPRTILFHIVRRGRSDSNQQQFCQFLISLYGLQVNVHQQFGRVLPQSNGLWEYLVQGIQNDREGQWLLLLRILVCSNTQLARHVRTCLFQYPEQLFHLIRTKLIDPICEEDLNNIIRLVSFLKEQVPFQIVLSALRRADPLDPRRQLLFGQILYYRGVLSPQEYNNLHQEVVQLITTKFLRLRGWLAFDIYSRSKDILSVCFEILLRQLTNQCSDETNKSKLSSFATDLSELISRIRPFKKKLALYPQKLIQRFLMNFKPIVPLAHRYNAKKRRFSYKWNNQA